MGGTESPEGRQIRGAQRAQKADRSGGHREPRRQTDQGSTESSERRQIRGSTESPEGRQIRGQHREPRKKPHIHSQVIFKGAKTI